MPISHSYRSFPHSFSSSQITQMFFDSEVYVAFVEACRAAGIQVPIIPGLMCINTVAGFKRMVGFCHTRVPDQLWKEMMALPKDDEEAVRRYGIAFGVRLSQELLLAGSPGLHYYCLNLSRVALGIVAGLGLGPQSVDTPPQTVEKVDEMPIKTLVNGADKDKEKEKEMDGELVGAVASS